MGTTSDDVALLDQLAEDFVGRLRRGELPSVHSYTDQHPALASEIRRLFPTLVTVEKLGTSTESDSATSRPNLPERIGDYRILRKLGEGGMGVVYEAIQEPLGRHVALKVLPSYAQRSDRYRERFRIEARAAARLHHPHIVPVYGVGQDGGQHYYAMQFISGRGLDELLRPSGDRPAVGLETVTLAARASTEHISAPSSAEINASREPSLDSDHVRSMARIAAQVAEALAYAHSEGVIHRDIKPSNLILDHHDCIWVTDFGLAKTTEADGLTEPGDIVGTIRYMAPERFSGWSDVRSDVYSLGVTLFELLTRRHMFDEADRGKLIQSILHTDPPRPRKFNRSIPSDLETIILKATAREPGHRYASADALADDLKRFLEGRPIRARRQTWASYSWSWCRRKPFVATMAGTVAALLLVLLTGSLIVNVRLDDQNRQIGDQNLQIGEAQKALTNQLVETNAARKSEQEAHQVAKRQLMLALRREAEAARWSRQPGSRAEALEAIHHLMELAREFPLSESDTLAVRNLTIAVIAQMDVVPESGNEPVPPDDASFTPDFNHYLAISTNGVAMHEHATGKRVAFLQMPRVFTHRFLPDNKHVMLGHDAVNAKRPAGCAIWNWQTNQIVGEIPTPTGRPYFAINRAGTEAALAYQNGSLALHRLPDGTLQKSLPISPGVRELAYSPDGQRLAIHRRQLRVEVWDLKEGKVEKTLTLPTETGVMGMSWSADGSMLAATCANYRAYVWHTENGQLAADLVGHQAEVTACIFDPNKHWVATTGWDSTTRFWNPVTGMPLLTVPGVIAAVSDDGRRIVYSQGRRPRIARVSGGSEFRSLHGHFGSKGPWHAAFSIDGRILASSGHDGVHFWDLASGHHAGTLKPQGGALTTLFHPDGKYLITAGRHHLSRWPISFDSQAVTLTIGTGEPLLPHQSDATIWAERRASMSSDGERIAVSNQSRQCIYLFPFVEQAIWKSVGAFPDLANALISPDGQWVVGASWPAGRVGIWNTVTGTATKHEAPPRSTVFAFSPDSQQMIVGNGQTARVLQVGAWTKSLEIPVDAMAPGLGGAVFSPDGRIVALVRDVRSIQLCDAHTWNEIARLQVPEGVAHLSFSPDSGLLATTATTHLVQVWDIRRIRSKLAEVGLDWTHPALPAEKISAGSLKVVVGKKG